MRVNYKKLILELNNSLSFGFRNKKCLAIALLHWLLHFEWGNFIATSSFWDFDSFSKTAPILSSNYFKLRLSYGYRRHKGLSFNVICFQGCIKDLFLTYNGSLNPLLIACSKNLQIIINSYIFKCQHFGRNLVFLSQQSQPSVETGPK